MFQVIRIDLIYLLMGVAIFYEKEGITKPVLKLKLATTISGSKALKKPIKVFLSRVLCFFFEK